MPPVTKQSGLFAKYGKKLADTINKHKDDPVDFGFQRLPPGIDNGVAQLVECMFGIVEEGKQNAGEYYFRAEGVVIEPDVNNTGIPVKNKKTSIFRMVCDTKDKEGNIRDTFDDNVAWVINELKKLGGEEIDVSNPEVTAEMLKQAAPYFSFDTSAGRTSKEFPNPKTFENWRGLIPDYEPEGGAAGAGGGGNDSSGTVAGGTESGEEESVAALVEIAKNGEESEAFKAGEKLIAMAVEAGYTKEEAEAGHVTWDDVATMIATPKTGENDATAEPTVGEICKFTPHDAKGNPTKNKQKRNVVVEVEIKKVDKKGQTADLLNNTDKKTKYDKQPWTYLDRS